MLPAAATLETVVMFLFFLFFLEGTGRGNLGIQVLRLGAVGIKVDRDEAGVVRVLALAERVSFPLSGKLCSVGTRLSVENTRHWVVTGDGGVKPYDRCLEGRSPGGGSALRGGAGVVAEGSGGAAREVGLARGTTGRAGIGAGGGAGVTICALSQRVTWIRERVFSIPGQVGRVATVD